MLAARSLGVSNRTILRRHVLPNAMVATLTYLPFILNGSTTALTALDFLGFGLPIDSPSAGTDALVGEGEPSGALAWVLRVCDVGDAADVADVYRGGGAGWAGSAKGGGEGERSGGWGWLDRRRLDWAGTRASDSLGALPSLMAGAAEGGRHPAENSRLSLPG